MSNDCGSVDTEEYGQDEEVNCVFCGKLFSSIERVQEHITQSHETLETNTENIELKVEKVWENKQLRVYDLNTELIINKAIDYNSVVQCSKCDLLFVNIYASRIHFEKVHLGRKRKRSTNPNGVEGIIVSPNGSNNWGCDICSRQFPTLKQAKVHKFKSHIEPLQKQKMMLHKNILRKNNVSQRNYVKKLIAESKFREILPNSERSKINKSVNEVSQQHGNKDGENCIHDDDKNHPQGCNSANGNGRPAFNLWRAAQAGSRGNKIVISRVYQSEVLLPGVPRTKYGYMQKNGYNCFYCREIFLNKENFTRHLLIHRRNKLYKCKNCGSKFHRINMLKQHQKHNCHIDIMKTSEALCEIRQNYGILSLKSEGNKTMTKNTDRELSLDLKIENQVHQKVIIQRKEDEVSPRDIKFAERFLNNSSITLNKGSQCVCNLCQSCFYSNNSILRHLVLYHRIAAQDGSTALIIKHDPLSMKTKSIQSETASDSCNKNVKPSLHFIHNCDHCGSQFASKKGLQRHLHSVHMIQAYENNNDGFQQEFACSECNLSFNDVAAYEIHKEECSGQSSSPGDYNRRVKCETCDRRFRNPVTLEEHQKKHENNMSSNKNNFDGANIFVLSDKSNGSSYSPVKIEEKVKHRGSGVKKSLSYTLPAYKKAKVPPNSDGLFECDVCHKTFTCRSSLSNHVKSHFNFKNKPFSCSSCKQGFMSTLTLQHHREQLCPNITSNNSNSDANVSGGCSVESVPQTAVFSNFEGLSQIPGKNYSTTNNDRTSPYVGNNNLTTRATSCMHCSAMFPDRSLLEDHASKEHSNHAGEVVCIICPRSFTTYMAFRVHMTKSHGGPNGTSLKSHLNTTNSLLKTSSSFDIIQDQPTSLNGEDSRVLVTSINGKMYHSRHSCANCDKDFSTSQALGNHKRACMPHLYKKVSL